MLKDYVASRPVCTYKPAAGSNAEMIYNYILSHAGCSHRQVVNHFKPILGYSVDGQIRQVAVCMCRHGANHLIPTGYSDFWHQNYNPKHKTQTQPQKSSEISFEELILAKKFMSKFGGIKKFKEVCEALELLEAA